MEFKQAQRKQARIRLGLQGPSGSGKTWGALQVAYRLCNDWRKIAVIDTENNSAALYSHLGPFNTVCVAAPFTPERYIEAIHLCEREAMQVIIIDSASHEWDGSGGILDIHGSMAGNSFTNWGKVTPRHNEFIQAMLQSPAHIIATIRSKQDYILVEKNGKSVPEKVGMKGVQRDGLEYDFTLLLELDIKNNSVPSKDRTSLFMGKPEFKITPAVGEKIAAWCNQGESIPSEDQLVSQIGAAATVDELMKIYKDNPADQERLLSHFTNKRKQLQIDSVSKSSLNPQKFSSNGTYHTKP